MAKQSIGLGSSPNDGTGITCVSAVIKSMTTSTKFTQH